MHDGGRDLFAELDAASARHVFSYLSARDLCAASMACREWRYLTNEDALWRDQLSLNPNPLLHPMQKLILHSTYKPQFCEQSTPKKTYEISENWRKGRAISSRLRSSGCDKSPAIKIAPGGTQLVVASGSRGTCHVFDVATGRQFANFGLSQCQEGEAMDGLSTCAAISGDCTTVAFGGYDGLARVYDVTRGSLRAVFGGAGSLEASVKALALSWDGSTLLAGLSNGHVTGGKLATWNASPTGYEENSEISKSEDVGFYNWGFVRRVGRHVAMTCVQPCMSETEEVGDGDGLQRQFVAGTSGGHVMVLDGETGNQKVGLVGSCSCPVACLCMHDQNKRESKGVGDSCTPYTQDGVCRGLLYGSYEHGILGHGHHNSVYVWDIASAARVALLYPEGKTLRCTGRGGRAVGGLGGAYWGLPVKSVYADGFKVALTAGKTVTVFETRTWEVLYAFRLSHFEEEGGREREGRESAEVGRKVEESKGMGAVKGGREGGVAEEPAPLGIYFSGSHLGLSLVGGAVGVLNFDVGAAAYGSMEVHFNRPIVGGPESTRGRDARS